MAWAATRKILFSLDAETAHHFFCKIIQNSPECLLKKVSRAPDESHQSAHFVMGMRFQNPLGLAAGFDKNAEILAKLPALGFGYAEIGTVTPRGQKGNPRPRLFRLPEERSLFNRMGFNNDGAVQIAKRLEKAREVLPLEFRVGVNIGKNKDTALEAAADDYRLAAQHFSGLADYLTINVSSPNTEGLRSLQKISALREIVDSVRNLIEAWRPRPPLLVKLSPEFIQELTVDDISQIEQTGVDGYIATNTLAGERFGMSGGLSGGILKELSREAVKRLRLFTEKPIISVGGIDSREEAEIRMNLGANLIQIYSSWIFEGPRLPGRIVRGLL